MASTSATQKMTRPQIAGTGACSGSSCRFEEAFADAVGGERRVRTADQRLEAERGVERERARHVGGHQRDRVEHLDVAQPAAQAVASASCDAGNTFMPPGANQLNACVR